MPGMNFGGEVFSVFSIFPVLFFLVFALVLGVILYVLFRTISQEKRNNQSPRLQVNAKVVTKRTDYHRNSSMHHGGFGVTRYFVTFEVESGDRFELALPGHAYGLLTEGDRGILRFQGKRYLSFERKVTACDL